MRRFESTPSVGLRTPAGRRLETWVAESFSVRLAGLAGLPCLPPGRALLLPGCRSVHTAGMRFAIDLAFVSWPPAGGSCDVVALRTAVPPFRVVAPRCLPPRIAALEAGPGSLAVTGVRPGSRLRADSHKVCVVQSRWG
jgi:uncharacterized membrane protein (UPF0127 family)